MKRQKLSIVNRQGSGNLLCFLPQEGIMGKYHKIQIPNGGTLGKENNHFPSVIVAPSAICPVLKKYLANISINKITTEELQQAILLESSNIIW